MRLRISDILLFVLLFVFIVSFPIDRLGLDAIGQGLVAIALRLLLVLYYGYIITKNRLKIFGNANMFNLLLFVPFLLSCFSNLIASGFNGGMSGLLVSGGIFAIDVVIAFLTAINEEIVFRLIIQDSLINCGSLKRIFAGAGIFALAHLLNIINVSSVDTLVIVLVQTIYTFGLGILLGFIYEYGRSISSCICFHFIFNFFNQVVVSDFGVSINTFSFYMTAVVIAVVIAIYTSLIYFFYLSKNDRYFRR